ncbi:serine/threonine protein kinase [Crinalium epipsammum PCC 9333]|uniref:non-specific serine/threonine protein kinase n=1 Tax=Crinalium epipsammum PCC 9333 TaxID=1173022 RepID=K9W5T3_9CYAN|nr:serine/threonine protein kinase [Crinalium epipsammum PCC 9333]
MSYCLNPQCHYPVNSPPERFCNRCGFRLLLKERYSAINPLGMGGFGRTFLAVDQDIPSHPKCVIKQLYFSHSEPKTFKKVVALFNQEAIRLDELGKHPQIPTLLASFEQEQNLYLVQDFIDGNTLEEELEKNGVYNESQIWTLLKSLLPVLQFIHDHQVVHRDIKPSNIIRRKTDDQLVLIDFGVAKLLTNSAILKPGTIIGSPEYMAPEQGRGKALPASDLYSLGVTCINLLTGVPTLDMFDIVNDCWMWQDFLPAGVKISDRLTEILDKLLKDSLKERYQSAEEVLQAINLNNTVKATNSHNLINLISELNTDYTKLQHLLAKKRWKEADEETWVVLCKASHKSVGSYLFNSDIDQLPCEDLQIINQLWLLYSSGRFGFSVQKRIYRAVGGEYATFCEIIGWKVHNSNFSDSALQFHSSAPTGHLPSRRWVGGCYSWWLHAQHMATRLEQCGIN